MADSGTCEICGEPVQPDQAELDAETGALVHADCYARKLAAAEGEEAEEP
jgi:hypothetical protein